MDSLVQLANELDVEPTLLKEAIRDVHREQNLEATELARDSTGNLNP